MRRFTRPALLLAALLGGFGVILGLAVLAGKLLAKAESADGSTGVDSSITSWVVAHRTDVLTTLAHAFSTVGSQVVLTPLVLIIALALVARRRLVAAGLLLVAWGGAIGLYTLTKDAVHRARPPMDLWLTDVGRSTAFPSGHATQSLATFVALALAASVWVVTGRRAARFAAVVLALCVGWSRVYLGVHWATDVVGGWLIATAWLAVVITLGKQAAITRRRRAAHRPAPTARP